MEHEVSSAVRLGVMLIAVSAVLGIVMVTVIIGLGIGNSASIKATSVSDSVGSAQLRSLSGREDIIMPKAAAYALIAQEEGHIVDLTLVDTTGGTTRVTTNKTGKWQALGVITGEFVSAQDSFGDKLSGKVKVEVTKAENDSGYSIVLTDQNAY